MQKPKTIGKSVERIERHVNEILIREMMSRGHLSEHDLSDRKKVLDLINDYYKGVELVVVIDHREAILRHAESAFLKAEYDFSIIFFAMYFEHAINNLIAHQIEKKEISTKAKNELIRSVNLAAKFGWLLELLHMPAFNDSHKSKILSISNERNAFVHYKWNAAVGLKKEQERARALICDIRKTVTYMKKYESRLLYSKTKGKITSTLKGSGSK